MWPWIWVTEVIKEMRGQEVINIIPGNCLSHPGLGGPTIYCGSRATSQSTRMLTGSEHKRWFNSWLFQTNRMMTRFRVILKADWESGVRVSKWESRTDWDLWRWQIRRGRRSGLPEWYEPQDKSVCFLLSFVLNKRRTDWRSTSSNGEHGQQQTHLLNLRYMECERINSFSSRKLQWKCRVKLPGQRNTPEIASWYRNGSERVWDVGKTKAEWVTGEEEQNVMGWWFGRDFPWWLLCGQTSEAVFLEYLCRTWLVDRQLELWHHRGTQFKFKLSWDFNYVLLPYSFGMSTKSNTYFSRFSPPG